MNIIDRFLAHAEARPERTALIVGERRLSYHELRDLAAGTCGLLIDMGVRERDVIVIALDNCVEFTLSMLAAAELGAIVAPVSTSMPGPALARAIGATGARFVVANAAASRRLLPALVDAAGEPVGIATVGSPPDGCRAFSDNGPAGTDYRLGSHHADPGLDYLLTMTSGSTGDPKPITLSQEGKIRRSLDGAKGVYRLGDDEVVITSTPMYHSLGFRLALLPLLIGGTSVILHHFSPRNWIDAVVRHGVSFAIMVSSHLEQIAQHLAADPQPLPSLKTLVSSSALLRPEVKQRCIALFDCDFHECYGASEVGIVTNLAPADCRDNLASVGKALDYVELRILDEHGKPLPHGGIGEIACRTATAFSGYYRRPDATAQAWHEGFFRTGDMGYLDDDGYLYLAGRKKDIIIVGGTNVYPDDVEAVLLQAPGVAACAVIGVPDAYFGEAILALVVAAADDIDTRRLRAHCAGQLADFQQPQAYELVNELPRTALGKIQRQVLRERYQGYDATADLRRFMKRGA